jgi:hypothetical protein
MKPRCSYSRRPLAARSATAYSLTAAASERTIVACWKGQFAHFHHKLTLHTDGGDYLVHWVPAGHDCPSLVVEQHESRPRRAASVGEPAGRDESTEAR